MSSVLVVGAGPTGLLLAAELARHGVDVDIVSDRLGPSTLSKAYGIHPRTLEMFASLGIIDEALALGSRTLGAQLHVFGMSLLRVPLEPKGTSFPFLLSLPQSQTERILLRYLERQGIRVRWNTPVDEQLCIAGHPVQADWIVGCDGADSTVRRAAGLRFAGHTYGNDWLLADVVLDTELERRDTHGFVNTRGYMALNPRAGRGSFRLIADVTGTPLAGQRELGRDAIDALFTSRGIPARLAGAPAATGAFRTQCRRAEAFRQGRFLLAGDAAHVHSPIGGQGLNAGLRDAWVLAPLLAEVVHGAPARTLEAYEADRIPEVDAVLATTDRVRAALTQRSWWGVAAVALGAAVLGRFSPLLRWFGAATNGLASPPASRVQSSP